MKYTNTDSINDVYNTIMSAKCLSFFFDDFMLNIISEEQRNLPVKELHDKVTMPWGLPFPSEMFVDAANITSEICTDKKYVFHPLWHDSDDSWIPLKSDNSKESVCLIATNTDTSKKKPAVLIVPGGGYEHTSQSGEGIHIASEFEKNGYCAFVLNYRLSPNRYPDPQLDLALAVRYIRKNADIYHIDADDILICGFSAGGHLVSSFTARYEEYGKLLDEELMRTDFPMFERYKNISVKPNKLCLSYPVISFDKEICHEGSFQALTGGDESMRDYLSIEKHIRSDWPTTFIWHCEGDTLVPVANSVRFVDSLIKAGVRYKFNRYPDGDHGLGVGTGTVAQGWIDEAIHYLEPELA